eukprot:gene3910-2776_t
MGHLWPYPSGEVEFPAPSDLPSSLVHYPSLGVKVSLVGASSVSKSVSSLLSTMEQNFVTEVTRADRRRYFRAPEERGILHISLELKDGEAHRADYLNDESYSLTIDRTAGRVSKDASSVDVHITATTAFGYRHALETLSQLITFDGSESKYAVVTGVRVANDHPSFPYRGIMIDVSRHFISVEKLKENIRAAAYNKMNVVHLHLSDTSSIPVSLPSQPNMTYFGAYNAESVFSTEDVQDLVEFANGYGIMLIPEIDAPAHMGAGWQWGSKQAGFADDLVVCYDAYAHGGAKAWELHALEPPGGQLNLANPASLKVLKDIYSDVLDQFAYPTVFHLGGDEVIVGSDTSPHSCYNNTLLAPGILSYLEENGLSRDDQQSFYQLWGNFTLKATSMVHELYKAHDKASSETAGHRKLHIWGGGGDDSDYNMFSLPNVQDYLPPSTFTVQVWDTSKYSIVPSLVKQGYEVILSHSDYVYLDCGNAGTENAGGYWCQPYHEWYHLYNYVYDVYQLYVKGAGDDDNTAKVLLSSEEFYRGVLGSETLIWTEMVDDVSVSQKLWPRSAALAEALWTNPHSNEQYRRRLQEQQGRQAAAWGRSDAVEVTTDNTLWYEAADRMLHWRHRLAERGVAAEALQPTCNEQYRRRLQEQQGRQAAAWGRSEAVEATTNNTLWYEAADRMLHWRHRLAERGVAAEALQPTWCRQRESGYCSRPTGTPQ